MNTNHHTLSPRQKSFADLVIVGMSAGRAWEKAGYLARGNAAEVQASLALKKRKFRDYIKTEHTRMEKAGEFLRDELAAYLIAVIRTPVSHLDESSNLVQEFIKEELAGGVIRTRLKMVAKLEACKQLASLMGWNSAAKVEVTASDQIAEIIAKIRRKD